MGNIGIVILGIMGSIEILCIAIVILSSILFILSISWWLYAVLRLPSEKSWAPFLWSMGSGVWLLVICSLFQVLDR